MLCSFTWENSVSPSLERVSDYINCGHSLVTFSTVHNISINFVIQFFVPCTSKINFFFFFEQVVGNVNFQFLISILVDTSVWDIQIWTIICTYDIVNVFEKSVSCFKSCFDVLVKQAIPSLIFWSISFTHICQCQWRVLRPCSSSAPANAVTVPNMPFPLYVCVLVSHLSKHSVNICMTLWNSKEQAPGQLMWLSG